jgi:hypothetical protein
MFRQFPVFTMLPNLRKEIFLIILLSILKTSQPKHGFRSILVILYNATKGTLNIIVSPTKA